MIRTEYDDERRVQTPASALHDAEEGRIILPPIAFDREGALDNLEIAVIERITELVPLAGVRELSSLTSLLNALTQRHIRKEEHDTRVHIESITLALHDVRALQANPAALLADDASDD